MNELDRIWNLIARKPSTDATEQEEKELGVVTRKIDEWEAKMDLINKAWNTMRSLEDSGAEQSFERVIRRLTSLGADCNQQWKLKDAESQFYFSKN